MLQARPQPELPSPIAAKNVGYFASLSSLGIGKMEIGSFLRLAVKISHALGSLHDKGVIHHRLNRQSILLNTETSEIGFDFSTNHDESSHYPYLSPEQTGRTNRAADDRSDLYSLGILFYQLLCGTLPFSAEDELGWFNAHLTIVPAPVTDIRPDLPQVIAEIVAKLLKKMPEERYQSVVGLISDLEYCQLRLSQNGQIGNFEIGMADRNARLSPPVRLYGRTAEIAKLTKDFEHSLTSDHPTLTLIAGFSGVGKTSLVRELAGPISAHNGFLISGKFDQHQLNVPYFIIGSALREFVLDRLAESETELMRWRGDFRSHLGPNTADVTTLVPEFQLLVGDSPKVAHEEASPAEAERRLFAAIRTLLSVITSNNRSLTIFLDDLQWADPATLRLLEYLATCSNLPRLFLIGAYRDNETSPTHPLLALIDRVKTSGRSIGELNILPLKAPDIQKLVADLLSERESTTSPLGDLVFSKTAGNPFFALQLLKAILSEGLLRFQHNTGHWIWDIGQIGSLAYSESAIDLMTKIISRLPVSTQKCLMLAAFLGNRFTQDTLAAVSELSSEQMALALRPALNEQLIARAISGAKNTFIFRHDKIQQAAFLQSKEADRPRIHLSVARTLLGLNGGSAENLSSENLFAITNHFNSGLSHVSSQGEKRQIALLNFYAGQHAKSTAAHASAVEFFDTALGILPKNSWVNDYQLTHDLLIESAECVYLLGQFDEAEKRLAIAIEKAQTAFERARAFGISLNLHTTKGEMHKALTVGQRALAALGWDFPLDPSRADVDTAYSAIWSLLGDRQIESLIDLPLVTDEFIKASLKILAELLLPAHFAGSLVNRYATAQIVLISIRHGITADSVHAFSWFAATLVDRSVGRYRDGYRFGKLSYDLVSKHGYASCKSKVCLFFGDIVNLYTHHFKDDRAYILEGLDAGIASGDLMSACYLSNHLVTNMLAAADPLDQVWMASEQRLDFVRRAKDINIEFIILSQQRFILNMLGKTKHPLDFSDDEMDQAEFEKRIQSSEMTLMKFWYYTLKMTARFIYGDYTAAAEAALIAHELKGSDQFDTESTQYFFFSALTLAHHYDQVEKHRKQEYLNIILQHRDQLKIWAESCPENFENRYLLISAELERITEGACENALRLYEKAMHSAETNGFIQNTAIICELIGKYHQTIGLSVSADAYFRKALAQYQRWGAAGKFNELKNALQESFAKEETDFFKSSSSSPTFSELVDLNAVFSAQRAISGELVPETLYQTFLHLALESAGAQRGALILFRENALSVQTEIEGDRVTSALTPLDSSNSVPRTLIQYVARLKKHVLLDDARIANPFSSDSYIRDRHPKSILCVPVIRQNQLMAIIYLENNLATQIFTSGILSVLQLLASQAAISIENSYLYEDLRRSVRVRDEFMAIASHELKTPLSSISVFAQTLRILLQRDEIGKYRKEDLLRLLDRSNNDIKHLATLIDQLLDVSRFTSGPLKLNPEPVDLSVLIKEVVGRFQKILTDSQSELVLDLAQDITGIWDKLRVEQVITNLLSNAVKYGASKPIKISTSKTDNAALLCIRDQGIGIAKNDQLRLFRPFERAVPYRSISGFGLGLFIVKSIVDAHGGNIELKSDLGKGSSFCVSLPTHSQ